MLGYVIFVAMVASNTAPPLTLEAALDEAGRQNIDLALARQDRERSSADALGRFRGLLPRLDLTTTFGHNFIGSQRQVRVVPTVDTNVTPAAVSYEEHPVWTPRTEYSDYTVGLRLEERLFDGLRSVAQIEQAEAAERAAVHQVGEVELTLAFEVTRRFYEVIKAEQSLVVLEQTVEQSEELVARADALFSAGRLTAGDTFAARVNLGNDQINVEAQRARVVQTHAELAAVLGRDVDPDLPVVVPRELSTELELLQGAASPSAYPEPPPVSDLLERARRNRPARARQREHLLAAELGMRMAQADYYPAIGITASYARQSPVLAGEAGVYGDLGRQYVLSGQLYAQWNIFDGLATKSASESARVDAERARLTAAQIDQQIAVEVVRARATLTSVGRSAVLARSNVQSAATAERMANERFVAGATSQLELRDVQLKLTQARLALVSAQSDYAVAVADLNRATGGGL